MEEKKIKLKRCPYCLSKKVEITVWEPGDREKHVVCRKCGAASADYNTEEQAAAAWNARAENTETIYIPMLLHKPLKIKSCPCCGSKEIDIKRWLIFTGYHVECQTCGTMTGDYKTWKDAVKAWNRRKSNTDYK